MLPDHYRYEIHGTYEDETLFAIGNSDLQVRLQTYPAVAETPAGYWLSYCGCCCDKWVPKRSRKRWAYPTKEEALHNFLKRKQKYIRILKYQLKRTEAAIPIAQDMLNEL